MGFRYANIIVNITSGQLDRTFQYRIPSALEKELKVGMQVEIPFGKGNRLITGYVIEITDGPEYPEEKLKDIAGIVKQGVSVEAKLVTMAAWMKRRYGSTMIQALKTVLPVKEQIRRQTSRNYYPALEGALAKELLENLQKKNQKARARFWEALQEKGSLTSSDVRNLKISPEVIHFFEEKGYILLEQKEKFRNPAEEMDREKERDFSLNPEQTEIIREIEKKQEAEGTGTCLIFGVTGSGKTEVYMELISRQLKKGKQAIVLIPEIALTYQTVRRFKGRFGNQVSFLNSRLSQGERWDQFQRAKKGEISVMIGPRSALFTPFPNLGLIVMDEEQEDSYQSETAPRYHAREAAAWRAKAEGAFFVLGSATPSIEAYYKAKKGEITLFRLTKRAREQSVLPAVSIVDMRRELKDGNKSMFSRRLSCLIKDRLEKGQQIMLFLNRRGYAGFLSCRMCGHVWKCPHCDVSLTLHGKRRLVCHYCGYEETAPETCTQCGSPYIAAFGTGTQKVETEVKKRFPSARVLRMDYDTTSKKGSHQEILKRFAQREGDILVGTQMIVKGHDFPAVTLVGILAADLSLSAPDYRAGEKTYQLLTQAAGRAGRGEKAGEAIIQTYQPDHYSIRAAALQDYERFYEQEMEFRRLLHYPPVYRLMTVQFSSPHEEEAKGKAEEAAEILSRLVEGTETATVIGPSSPAVGKRKDIYYQMLYVKEKRLELLIRLKDRLEAWAAGKQGEFYIQFDIR